MFLNKRHCYNCGLEIGEVLMGRADAILKKLKKRKHLMVPYSEF